MKHLIDLDDFTSQEIDLLVNDALRIRQNPKTYCGAMTGKIMGTLFYEPSTRTQISFQTAMLKLGGQLVGFDNPLTSSVAKGENLKDTIKVVSSYADLIVLRHPEEGSAKAASLASDCPIINAGDGSHLHPTQTLTDLVTLKSIKGRLDHLVIGLCGDLKYGRTVHSLIKTISHYPGNEFILISTEHLTIPDYLKKIILDSGSSFREIISLEEALPLLDVVYMTRVQRERFDSLEEYERQKDVYRLTMEKLQLAKPDLSVLHPLPRLDEIATEVDDDPRAAYFLQAKLGVYARMALILHIFDSADTPNAPLLGTPHPDRTCRNPRCITNSEHYLQHVFHQDDGQWVCSYCDCHQ